MSNPTRICVVTLAWRNELHAESFVTSLNRATADCADRVELVVVENGSDGAEAASIVASLARPELSVEVVRSPTNLGFAGGMNLGIAAKLADLYVIANLDITFDEAFFRELEPFACQVPAAAIVFFRESSNDVAGGLGRKTWVHRVVDLGSWEPSALDRGVRCGSAACFGVTRGLVEVRTELEGELFDGEYHSYYEDLDLFWWAAVRGIERVVAERCRFSHVQAGSFEGVFRFEERSPVLQASIIANYRLNAWKHCATPSQALGAVVGELGYAWRCLRVHGFGGATVLFESWRLFFARRRRIVARRRNHRAAARPVVRA